MSSMYIYSKNMSCINRILHYIFGSLIEKKYLIKLKILFELYAIDTTGVMNSPSKPIHQALSTGATKNTTTLQPL